MSTTDTRSVADYTDRLTYISFDEATTPRDGEVLTNRWWVVHPSRGLAYYFATGSRDGSPQCNHDRRLPEQLVAEMYPGHEVRHVPAVFTGRYREVY